MKLIPVDTLRTWMNFYEGAEYDKALAIALENVSRRLANTLRTGIVLDSATDRFYLDPYDYQITHGPVRLALSNGFVRPSPVFNLSYASSQSVFLNNEQTALTEGEDYEVFAERGVVLLHTYARGSFIQAKYDFGFTPEEDDILGEIIVADEQDDVPDWLQEAVISWSDILVRSGLASGSSEGADARAGHLPATVLDIIEPYIRINNSAVKPNVKA